ncbi:acetyltransferase [Pseudonocardia sulfidoxydans NBRC 16205]|uniref:Acetyltransferase n=1 Tax=Pseudonocardia sulfidoxydans NBRC 16205 TaxID=1223511 RepID=A0A511DL12_9PSEU|nr:GNAT family N-acetyltransferase [Pseudonocardia sulfidoxydans]GEL25496.1 acetyltransferase [Pseudonocardia sulfidoxydans NBRC 16205]
MTAAPPRHRLVQLGPVEFAARVDEALAVYVAAMGYPRSTARQRRSLWLDHGRRPGWRAVGWLDAAGALVGIAYGYSGGAGQWWYDEVRRGLDDDPAASLWLSDYLELTELHVRPDTQGARLGEGLLRALLTDTGHSRVLLSTPEYGERPPGRAWRLYRRTGFVDVLRHHRFTGDARPFAVLGRTLPLDPPDTGAPQGPPT